MEQDHFFKGLKVVELASVLAGPAVGLFFAELGAEVIKVENKTTGGDVTRKWRLASESKTADYSAYYCSVNAAKQSLLLDLKNEEDKAQVMNLISAADIVISNFRPKAAIKLGFDYDSLSAKFPQLIYGQIYGYGATSNRPAFDVALQAEAGFLYMTGENGGKEVKMPVALIDLIAAHQLKEGLLLALLKRYQSRAGSFVSVSLLQAAIASLANQATNWLIAGHIPQKMGTAHPNIAPYGDILESKDHQKIVLAVGTEKQFLGLINVLELQYLSKEERFKNNKTRVAHRDALVQILVEKAKNIDAKDLITGLEKYSVPYGRVRNMAEVFELPAAKEMLVSSPQNNGKTTTSVKSIAFKLS